MLIYLLSPFFWEWGFLSLSFTLLFLFLSSFGALFINSSPLPPHEMRFPGEWSPNLIALFEWCTLGYMFCFFDVVVIGFLLCCSSRLVFFPPCPLHINFKVLSLFCVWTGSVSSHLSCIPSITRPIFVLCTCLMWECCDRFEWSLCCIRRLLIGFSFLFFLGLLITLWLCEAPLFGCV